MSSRKDLLSSSQHHKKEINKTLERDLKEESFGPYQDRSITLLTNHNPSLSPATEARNRNRNISKDHHKNADEINDTFLTNFVMKNKKNKKNSIRSSKILDENREEQFSNNIIHPEEKVLCIWFYKI